MTTVSGITAIELSEEDGTLLVSFNGPGRRAELEVTVEPELERDLLDILRRLHDATERIGMALKSRFDAEDMAARRALLAGPQCRPPRFIELRDVAGAEVAPHVSCAVDGSEA